MRSRKRRGVGTVFGAGIVLAATAQSARAETTLAGGSLGPQTWTAAESPYLVTGDLDLESLTVEAGTTVRFAAGPGDGLGFHIFVDGPLVIEGTEEAPAVFEPMVDDGFWWGIKATSAKVTGATLRRGPSGIIALSRTEPMVVRNSTLEMAMLQPSGPLLVDRSRFIVSAAAVLANTGAGDIVVANSEFRGRGWTFDTSRHIVVTNCTFDGGQITFMGLKSATIKNSIFTNMQRLFEREVDYTLSSSLLWNIREELPERGTVEGDGILRANPQYVGTDDLRLKPGSPAVDSGSPEGAPEVDIDGESRPQGNGIDMGAYELGPTDAGAGGQGGDGNHEGGGGGDDDDDAPSAEGGGSVGGQASGGTSSIPKGGAPSSAGTGGKASSSSGSASESGGAGGTGGAPADESSGCGVSATHSVPLPVGWSATGIVAALLAVARRRRRRDGAASLRGQG